jgi:multicomponent Na+:H+ antiporter subunit C
MSQFLLYALVSAALFAICAHGLITRAHLIRKVLAVNMMGSAVFLLFVAVAYRNRGEFADPVPHAMVLTGIVVAVSATALALALVRRIHAATGRTTLSDGDEDGDQ